MENWPRLYPTICNCQGKNHKFFKNCLSCGLIFCQQNSKLTNCTFCTLPFDSEILSSFDNRLSSASSDNRLSSASGDNRKSLKSALELQNRLLAADSNSTGTNVKEEFSEFIQLNFYSNSEILSRQKEIEAFKVKLAKEKEEKSTFDLSQMLQNV